MSDLYGPADYAASYDRTEILEFVADLAPDLERNDPAFRVAAILTASLVECGPDARAIAGLLGYEEAWVQTVDGRLRAAGVWRDDEVAIERPVDAADFSYRSWRQAVRAGLGTLENENVIAAATRKRRPLRQDGLSLRPNRYSSESKRRGRSS